MGFFLRCGVCFQDSHTKLQPNGVYICYFYYKIDFFFQVGYLLKSLFGCQEKSGKITFFSNEFLMLKLICGYCFQDSHINNAVKIYDFHFFFLFLVAFSQQPKGCYKCQFFPFYLISMFYFC